MKQRRRSLFVYIIFLSAMVALPPMPHRCLASSGNFSLRELIAEEKAGKDAAARKKEMLDYGAYVDAKKEVPLKDFLGGGDDAASRAGRDKARLVLHLLRRVAGEEAFGRAAGKMLEAPPSTRQSWNDVRIVFERETGKDLGPFFQQWVDRKGLPDLRVENASVRRNGDQFEVSFDLLQAGDVYTLELPISISFTQGGEKAETVKLEAGKKHASLLVDREPASIVIDREYEVPRKPTVGETPPLLAKILNEENPYLVLPEDRADIYPGVISAWKGRGAREMKAADVKDRDIRTSALIVLGADNPVLGRIYGKAAAATGELYLSALKNPWNPGKAVVMVEAKSMPTADLAIQMLSESGDCSSLSVDDRGQVTQKTEETDRGIRMDLREEPAAVDLSAVKRLSRVIEGVAAKKIVYVGEYHDRFAHHTVQLQVIEGMYRKDPKIAIGMEMFQRPFQAVLDAYMHGETEEREFLEKSEYFKRWGFDYNLYKPILDFARAEKIPVIALNLRQEITDKVSKGGIDSLTDDERKEIPAQTDFSDADYRERLRQVFDRHKAEGPKNFDFFYQAQILWDETMAMSIDEYLKKNPERRMVVMAGEGHLIYGSGIPERAFRRNGYEYAVILNDATVDPDVANYLVYPQPLEGVTAPKLMVLLKELSGKVVIEALPKGSVSGKAGLKEGDAIVALDGAPVQTVADIRTALFYKKDNDEVRVRIARRRFLLGEKEMEFVVKLQ